MELIIRFVENRLSTEQFFADFYQDTELEKTLSSETTLPQWARKCATNLYLYIITGDARNEDFVSSVRELLEAYLEKNEIPFKHNPLNEERLALLLDASPAWVDPTALAPISGMAHIKWHPSLLYRRA